MYMALTQMNGISSEECIYKSSRFHDVVIPAESVELWMSRTKFKDGTDEK